MAKISNNQSWENIFNKYKLLSEIRKNGFVDITSNQIKAVDGKESRLMTKTDHRQNLPEIMRAEGLSILAINNGTYRIAVNDPFIDIQENISTPIVELTPPRNILSINPYNIKSESAALDIAAISDMNRIVFGEESDLTIRGRLRGSLTFNIEGIFYDIDGVQIEVDGGYESANAIHLIEAKNGYRDNINIRQLLYPQLYWQNELAGRKQIKSYIFYLQGDIFRFIPYEYDGIVGLANHAEEKAFRFTTPDLEFSLYQIEINRNNIDYTTSFPQADKLQTIDTMLLTISQYTCLSKEELSNFFDIVDRQISYYFSALKWLKLCYEEEDCLLLTQRGREISNLAYRERMKEIAKIIFSDPLMNTLLHERRPTDILLSSYNLAQSTINRRMQTARAWITHLKNLFENQ